MPKRLSRIALSPLSSNMTKNMPRNGLVSLKKSKVDHSPSWNLKDGVDSLPGIPFYHVPSNTFAIVQETNPRTVSQRIAIAVAHMSSVGNYSDELVSCFCLHLGCSPFFSYFH